ncbi:ATP-binding protein [Streptomyces sp. NPDC059271]|uniref:ATP-binding protein n=1 Tax=Streptomyces sp. NPDC059271 TaxID=3346799 RepID=UPI003675F09E
MTTPEASPAGLTPQQVGELFLFEELDDGQLAWLSRHGHVQTHPGGHPLYREGEPATSFYVLLSGTITISRHVHGADIELNRTSQRGAYAGATRAYLTSRAEDSYPNTLHALTDLELFVLPAHAVAYAVRTWFPMAAHLLDGLAFITRRTNVLTGERERLLSLGTLAAGLTHELNNPAAAAARAAAELQQRTADLQDALTQAHDAGLTTSQLAQLAHAANSLTRTPPDPGRGLLDAADAEDALASWLTDRGVSEPFELASALTSAGITQDALQQTITPLAPEHRTSALRWMSALIDLQHLTTEVASAVDRVENLVTAAGAYAQLDRAARQMVDIRELLDATLTVMKPRVPASVRVVRNYPDRLPLLLACGADLNQAWTRLIDNALSAMPQGGELTLTCTSDESHIHVTVSDTGTGIAEEDRTRIYDPFFTTRPLGEGAGLGLTVVHEVIAVRHQGSITLTSHPGDTTFRISLPLHPNTTNQQADSSDHPQ